LGGLALVENFIPPVPADTAVAFGAFLSHRGITQPAAVFTVTWAANTIGATAVYAAARRYGRGYFAKGLGKRLLSPRHITAIEREYARFGLAGIFVSRFLPGVRAVVPPFAGLVGLGPWRAIVPIATASALWYGAITVAGALVGAEWQRVSGWIADANRTLLLLTLLLALAAVVWVLRRRDVRRRRLAASLRRALDREAAEPHPDRDPALRAAAALVLELVYADETMTQEERGLVEAHLTSRWDLPPHPTAAGEAELFHEAGRLLGGYDLADRLALLDRMGRVSLREGEPGPNRRRLLDRAARLLQVEPGRSPDGEAGG